LHGVQRGILGQLVDEELLEDLEGLWEVEIVAQRLELPLVQWSVQAESFFE
jgi:hypothetical protein